MTLPRIFFIGMNRTATKALSSLVSDSGYIAYHFSGRNGENIAKTIKKNVLAGNPPLDTIDGACSYADMAYHEYDDYIEGNLYFRELYQAYPDSYFILNTRTEANWLRSRINHKDGDYLKRCREILGAGAAIENNEVYMHWMNYRRIHHSAAISYLTSKTDRFMIFDTEYDNISKVAEKLKAHYNINTAHWKHVD